MTTLRKWLLAGLLVIVPLAVTLSVLHWIVVNLDGSLKILPEAWHPDRWLGIHIPGLGVLFALLVVLSIGALTSNMVGRQFLNLWNRLLHRIPVVRPIYSSVKQISDTFFSEKGNAFSQAVLVQWPREGMWTIGFLTGDVKGSVSKHLPEACCSVFIPTTPNPTSGYLMVVKKTDCIPLEMSVDSALAYVISMGVIEPKPLNM